MDKIEAIGAAIHQSEMQKRRAECVTNMAERILSLKSENAALREQLAAAQATIANLEQTARNATLHWNAVAEQLTAAQKDAERYRWLRKSHHDDKAGIGVTRERLNGWGRIVAVSLRNRALDAAIDAAMKEE